MAYENYTKEKLKEKYRALPKALKDFVTSEKLDEALKEIVEKNELSVEQGGILENEITLVILGFTKAEDFPKSLREGINLEKEKLNGLLKDVDDKIFTVIRNSMKRSAETLETKEPEPESLDRESLLASIEHPNKSPEISTAAPSRPRADVPSDKDFLSENVAVSQASAPEPNKFKESRSAPRNLGEEKPLEVPLKRIVENKPEMKISGDKLNQKTHLPRETSNLNLTHSQGGEKVRPDDGAKKIDPYREPTDN